MKGKHDRPTARDRSISKALCACPDRARGGRGEKGSGKAKVRRRGHSYVLGRHRDERDAPVLVSLIWDCRLCRNSTRMFCAAWRADVLMERFSTLPDALSVGFTTVASWSRSICIAGRAAALDGWRRSSSSRGTTATATTTAWFRATQRLMARGGFPPRRSPRHSRACGILAGLDDFFPRPTVRAPTDEKDDPTILSWILRRILPSLSLSSWRRTRKAGSSPLIMSVLSTTTHKRRRTSKRFRSRGLCRKKKEEVPAERLSPKRTTGSRSFSRE